MNFPVNLQGSARVVTSKINYSERGQGIGHQNIAIPNPPPAKMVKSPK